MGVEDLSLARPLGLQPQIFVWRTLASLLPAAGGEIRPGLRCSSLSVSQSVTGRS